MRNISFMYTLPQMVAELKDITRRVGWWFLEGGEILQAVEKGMGIPRGGHVVPIYPIQIITATPEALSRLLKADRYAYDEVRREGFPDLTPKQFVDFFCSSHKKCTPDTVVNRIEFRRAK